MAPSINICLVGQKFMGRTHSNAYLKIPRYFDLALQPVMHTLVARDKAELEAFARRWGWANSSTDWKRTFQDPGIGLVDIGAPNNAHAELAIAALEAGKHVACEKPLANTLAAARRMRDAARKARKQRTFVWYNYRRVPAVALAHQLVKEGRLGRLHHVRGYYLQDWAGPDVPLIWRFQKKVAGSGAHGDLNAHIIDMARFITGQEIAEVSGAVMRTFITERVIPSRGSTGGISGGARGSSRKGKSDVDDAVLFVGKMTGGAVCSFEATRFATGYQNKNGVEVHGEHGAVSFNFEDMNYLHWCDNTAPARLRGWTRIPTTGADHPWAGAYWPPAHIIGYEHTFMNQAADMLNALGGRKPIVPLPDFEDAYTTQRVLQAVSLSVKERCAVKVSEIK